MRKLLIIISLFIGLASHADPIQITLTDTHTDDPLIQGLWLLNEVSYEQSLMESQVWWGDSGLAHIFGILADPFIDMSGTRIGPFFIYDMKVRIKNFHD